MTQAPSTPMVVTLPAEIDMANADRVFAELQAAFAPGVSAVVADMTATTFCDSRGYRALVLAHKHAAANGAELRLVVPSARVLRVMGVLGLDAALAVYPSLPEALAGEADGDAGAPGDDRLGCSGRLRSQP
jgi:anti-anti-sigma factor